MLNLMSLEKVKTLLGITGTDYDAMLSEFLPIVSADVRRILNDPMDGYCKGRIELYSDELVTDEHLNLGRVITSTELPADTYVKETISKGYRLSAKAIGDALSFTPTILIAQWQAIARMVFYRAGNAKPIQASEKVQSKSMGPVSISYSLNIDSQWNYPKELLDDLGKPRLKTC